MAREQPAQPDIPDGDALQALHFVAYGGKHLADLPVLAFVNRDLNDRRARILFDHPHLRRDVTNPPMSTPLRSLARRALERTPATVAT